jgi:hypothetical protein
MADFQVKPVLTDQARLNLGSMLRIGYPAFQITHFGVGTGGYSASNPTVALSPNPSSSQLQHEIFRSPNVTNENADEFSIVFVGQLGKSEGVGPLGEVGLYGTYLSGPAAGQVFLFAMANFPLQSKTPQESKKFRMVVLL